MERVGGKSAGVVQSCLSAEFGWLVNDRCEKRAEGVQEFRTYSRTHLKRETGIPYALDLYTIACE